MFSGYRQCHLTWLLPEVEGFDSTCDVGVEVEVKGRMTQLNLKLKLTDIAFI